MRFSVRTGALLLMAVLLAACGGSSSPGPTSPTPSTPSGPTTTTVTLDAPSDQFLFSSTIARLTPGGSADVRLRWLRNNVQGGENFGHAIMFWMLPDPELPLEDRVQAGLAMGFQWIRDELFQVISRQPNGGYEVSTRQLRIPAGSQLTVRVTRGGDGVAALIVGNETLLSLPSAGLDYLTAEVVAVGVEFTYNGSTLTLGTGTGARTDASRRCGRCPRPLLATPAP